MLLIECFTKKKFGLQMEPVKLIYVYRNGDPFHQGATFFVKHSIKSMRVLFRELTHNLHGAAPVRELYDQQFQKIHRLSDFLELLVVELSYRGCAMKIMGQLPEEYPH